MNKKWPTGTDRRLENISCITTNDEIRIKRNRPIMPLPATQTKFTIIIIFVFGLVALQLANVFVLLDAPNSLFSLHSFVVQDNPPPSTSATTTTTSSSSNSSSSSTNHTKTSNSKEQEGGRAPVRGMLLYDDHGATPAAAAAITTIATTMQQSTSGAGGTFNFSNNTSSYIDCMLKLERTDLSRQRLANLEESNLPIPFAVKIDNHRFWVLVMLHTGNRHLRSSNIYFCNGIPAQVAKTSRKGLYMLIVGCSETIDARTSSLNTFSGSPRAGDKMGGVEFSFDMQTFEECERKDIEFFAHLSPTAAEEGGGDLEKNGDPHQDGKIGIVAVFNGGRKNALEWAVYHHIIGVDHIFLYVNEDWDDGKDLVHRDYITWIPYNFRLITRGSPVTWESFREAGMTDMVWRARRLNMKWLVDVDTDEFVWVNGTLYPEEKPLVKFLNTYPIPETYGAFQMNSIPFGANNSKSPQVSTRSSADGAAPTGRQQLVMEYVYRQNADVKTFPRVREKIIVNTTKVVTAINCHYIGGGTNMKVYPVGADIIRVNHYKLPHKGVFNRLQGQLPPSQIIRDTDLMDRFFDAVSREMASS